MIFRFVISALFLWAAGANAGPIQDLINQATNGATIFVPPGEYHETLDIRNGVFVVGAGSSSTILDGDGADLVVHGGKQSAIIGFTIRNGKTAVWNEGRFMGVFECDIQNFGEYGIKIEGGSAALVHNRVAGQKDRTTGVACLGSNPYVGYSDIRDNKVGLLAQMQFIPVVDHNAFTSNETGILVRDAARVELYENAFDGNGVNVAGQEEGAAARGGLRLHRGSDVNGYRRLMKEIFDKAVAMHNRVIYDLPPEPERFHVTVLNPWATFNVSASTRDTVLEVFDAYDRSNDHDLKAFASQERGLPTVNVVNPELQEKNLDRYVVEKIFYHPPSYRRDGDNRLVFDRITNISRIEVRVPAGYHVVEANHPGEQTYENGRYVLSMSDCGLTHLRVVMQSGK